MTRSEPEMARGKTNRSAEELAIRDLVESWGRPRWPGARVVHELVTGQCRIDVAFVQPDHLAGVEIKSSKDGLDRLDKQLSAFVQCIPEVWLVSAPKWAKKIAEATAPWSVGWAFATAGHVSLDIRDDDGTLLHYPHRAKRNTALTVPMLELLWRSELHAVAARAQVWSTKGKPSRTQLIDVLARKLTGDEIVAGVCRELRARDAFWKADPPIYLDGPSGQDMPGHLDLFRAPTDATLSLQTGEGDG